MNDSSALTWYAGRPRWQVLLILAALVGGTGWCLWVAVTTTVPERPQRPGPTDEEFYLHVVERVRAGENYYDAAADEFHQAGYTVRSTFNWRTPLYAWIIGKAPDRKWAQTGLTAAALLVLGMTFVVVGRDG